MIPDEIERRVQEHETRPWKIENKAYAAETRAWVALVAIVLIGIILALLLASDNRVQGAETAEEVRNAECGVRNEAAEAPRPTLPRLLAAIREVESSGGRDKRDGDDGAAIGPYQIHRDYWIDSGVPGRWEDCLREPYARRVVLAYMRRHEPAALSRVDAQVLARLHNGGPTWREKPATIRYWRKVRAALDGGGRSPPLGLAGKWRGDEGKGEAVKISIEPGERDPCGNGRGPRRERPDLRQPQAAGLHAGVARSRPLLGHSRRFQMLRYLQGGRR